MLPNTNRLLLLVSLSVSGLSGCTDSTLPQDSYARVAISGTISLDDAPLKTGIIQFDPASGTNGPQASSEIVAGKFSISKAQGPVSGKYKVSISGKTPVKIDLNEQPGGSPKAAPDPVPPKYNSKSTLETEIPAGGSDSLEFALKK